MVAEVVDSSGSSGWRPRKGKLAAKASGVSCWIAVLRRLLSAMSFSMICMCARRNQQDPIQRFVASC